MKAPVTRREAVERETEMLKEIAELEEIVSGAKLTEENLTEYIKEVCNIIYFRMPDKELDVFVTKMLDLELYQEVEVDE